MTNKDKVDSITKFTRLIANRILTIDAKWSAKDDWWWYLGQIASKVNELEEVMKTKSDVSNLVADISILCMQLNDIQHTHIKKTTEKSANKTTKKKTVKKKVSKK